MTFFNSIKSRRAIRRFHRKRLLKKRSYYWAGNPDFITARVVNTPKPCSCFMCGNPRKFFKEKRRDELMEDERFNLAKNVN